MAAADDTSADMTQEVGATGYCVGQDTVKNIRNFSWGLTSSQKTAKCGHAQVFLNLVQRVGVSSDLVFALVWYWKFCIIVVMSCLSVWYVCDVITCDRGIGTYWQDGLESLVKSHEDKARQCAGCIWVIWLLVAPVSAVAWCLTLRAVTCSQVAQTRKASISEMGQVSWAQRYKPTLWPWVEQQLPEILDISRAPRSFQHLSEQKSTGFVLYMYSRHIRAALAFQRKPLKLLAFSRTPKVSCT